LATVFEEGIFMGRSFTLGQVPPRRVRQFQADFNAKRLIPFRKMMEMSVEDHMDHLSRILNMPARFVDLGAYHGIFVHRPGTSENAHPVALL
jgi:hypothetical protein